MTKIEMPCTCATRYDGEGGVGIPPDVATCGTCGRSWCDRCNPTHGPRCWFEDEHVHVEDADSPKAKQARDYLRSIVEQANEMLAWPGIRLETLRDELALIDDGFPSYFDEDESDENGE